MLTLSILQSLYDAMLTNVYDVTSFIDHDVAIVSVLDLQQVADEGIGGHAPDKTAAGLYTQRVELQLAAQRTLLCHQFGVYHKV